MIVYSDSVLLSGGADLPEGEISIDQVPSRARMLVLSGAREAGIDAPPTRVLCAHEPYQGEILTRVVAEWER